MLVDCCRLIDSIYKYLQTSTNVFPDFWLFCADCQCFACFRLQIYKYLQFFFAEIFAFSVGEGTKKAPRPWMGAGLCGGFSKYLTLQSAFVVITGLLSARRPRLPCGSCLLSRRGSSSRRLRRCSNGPCASANCPGYTRWQQ